MQRIDSISIAINKLDEYKKKKKKRSIIRTILYCIILSAVACTVFFWKDICEVIHPVIQSSNDSTEDNELISIFSENALIDDVDVVEKESKSSGKYVHVTWKKLEDVKKYYVELSTDEGFDKDQTEQQTTEVNEADFSTPSGGNFYCRVKAVSVGKKKDRIETEWSQVRNISVERPKSDLDKWANIIFWAIVIIIVVKILRRIFD